MTGRPPWDGPVWNDPAWDGDQDFAGQDFAGQDANRQRPSERRYGERGYGEGRYGQPGAGGRPYRPQRPGPGARPRQYPPAPLPGATRLPPPGYDPRGTGPGPRYDAGYGPQGGYGPGGYRDQGDDSFLPGFGAPPARGYGDPRAPRSADPRSADPRGPRGPGGPGRPRGPGPGGRGPRGRGDWEDERDTRPPRRRKSVMRRLAPWIAVLVILAPIVYGGLYVYGRYKDKYHPVDYIGAGTGNVTVEVLSGDNAYTLGPRLLSLGVIGSTRAFENAADAAAGTTGTDSSGLEAGYFVLHHHMQASLAYAALIDPKNRVQTTVTIPEGKRASQVALILAKYTKLPLKEFQQIIARPPASLGLPAYAKGKIEGYLFPATYAIVPHETALQILQAMVARFNVEADQAGLTDAAKKVGLTAGQVITEASMAQSEGGSDADFPKIAEVIDNRIKLGMNLRFDSTVVYGLGKYSVSATYAELKINTPYNTYLHPGLPIGPISNPGDAAIQAILHPDKGNYLYFLTKPGGASVFSHSCLPGQC